MHILSGYSLARVFARDLPTLKAIGIIDIDVSLDHLLDPTKAALQASINDYLPKEQIDKARQLIKQRIIVAIHTTHSDVASSSIKFSRQHPSAFSLTEDNVYLYPSDISAMFHMN
jgi:hypothetical protein